MERYGFFNKSYRKQDEDHADGWWTTAIDQTPWETEGTVGGLEIDNTEGCDSKGPRRGKEEDRKWSHPLKYGVHSNEIDQLKNDEKKDKQSGTGTQGPLKKTARDRDPRTRDSANSRQTNPNLVGWCKRQRGTSETSASTTTSTSGTSESGRRRRRTPTPAASPTPKPTRSPSESSATSEMSASSEVGRRASARWSGGLQCRPKTR